MNRREAVLGLGSLAAGAVGYGTYMGDIEPSDLRTIQNSTNPESTESDTGGGMTQEFGMFSGGFEKIKWSTNGVLAITISDDHQMDGFGIRHEKVGADDYNDYLTWEEVSLDGGRFTVNFESELTDTYPSRNFTLASAEGEFGFVNVIDAIKANVSFTVPEKAIGSEYFPK